MGHMITLMTVMYIIVSDTETKGYCCCVCVCLLNVID